MKETFNSDELELNDWQYFTSHDSTLKFRIGDIVFLKSNPEMKLRVINVDTEKVFCINKDKDIVMGFYPQTILHYKDAGLVVYKKEYVISLN